MFSLKKTLKASNQSQADLSKTACDSLIICSGKSIKGDVIFTGDCRLEGEFSGKMITDGKLVITQTGKLNGTVYAQNVIVEGFFEGTVICKSNFLATNTSKIIGSINAANFEFEECVHFDGIVNQINNDEYSKYLQNRYTPDFNPKIELSNIHLKPTEHSVQHSITKNEALIDDSKIKVVKLDISKKIKVEKLEAEIQEPLKRQSWF